MMRLCTVAILGAPVGLMLSVAAPAARAQQGRDDATFTWSKTLAAGASLTIRNGNGPIDVHESSSDRVEVRAAKVVRGGGSLRDVAFDVRESDDGVTICTLYGSQTSCRDQSSGNRNIHVRVEYTVLIPRTLRLTVATGNGAVTIDRAGADVSASTGNGRITIGSTTGRVQASTGNGEVQIEDANGPVRVSTGNGRVSVVTASGGVSASTGDGDIDVRIKSLPADADDMAFTSGAGSVRITLPADYNGRIDAMSGAGSLRSDFDISIVGRLDAHHVRGTIGKGGALLRITTGAGQIALLKE